MCERGMVGEGCVHDVAYSWRLEVSFQELVPLLPPQGCWGFNSGQQA